MVVDEFLKAIEGVYGIYENKILKTTVKKYLEEDIEPSKLSELYRVVLYGHKANFGVPCIATIEECIHNARMKKGKYEPYRVKTMNPDKYNYREEKAQITEQERKDNLKRLSQFKVKRVSNE